jgi:UDP-N-acetylglucosamine 4,6-dehydratase
VADRVLITGGSGFLGRALAYRLRDHEEVVLAARNREQLSRAAELTGCGAIPLDVASAASVRDVFHELRPDVVVHAAASKHVDTGERHPMECFDVNVAGTQAVARAAVEVGVRAVVGISTDKAAAPQRTIYGLSKSAMERLFAAMHGRGPTAFTTVRLGNIAWSTGSVLPVWDRMAERSGLIRTTGRGMRRFMCTAADAAEFVHSALEHVDEAGGRVLVRPLEAVAIADLLDLFCELRGARWEAIPPRPGDTADQALVSPAELAYAQPAQLGGEPRVALDFGAHIDPPVTEPILTERVPAMGRDGLAALLSASPH